MNEKKKSNINIKQQVKKIIALVCAVCFIIVFMFSTVHFIGHADETSPGTGACKRTLQPECKCDPVIAQLRMQVETSAYNETHVDCFVCAVVHKTIDQTRQLSAAAGEVLLSDINLLILAGLFTLFIFAGGFTPVKLKTRTNN